MKTIKINQSLKKEQWEKLHNTDVMELNLSIATYSSLKRAGYYTVGDLADSTEQERAERVKYVDYMNNEKMTRVMKEILEKLNDRGIALPSEADKQAVLDSMTEVETLQWKLDMLRDRNKELETQNALQEKLLMKMGQMNKQMEAESLTEARALAEENNSVACIIAKMFFHGKNGGGNTSFCDIFKLYEHGCLADEDSHKGLPTGHSCERCIDMFIRKYYLNEMGRSNDYGKDYI